ncbi:MAG: acyltransferase [Sphingobacteriaceae bacterium]|nr:MAG: acyltransferase [Sphingobacteriaceae bacterium]
MKKDLIVNKQPENLPQYIPVINSLRGLAAVVVCIFHLICLPLNFLENTELYQIAPYGKYGVQIFFVITGVVIPISLINSKYNYLLFWKFIYKRIVRIEPPYLFTILIGLILLIIRNQFLSGTPHDIPSLKNILLHVGYLIPFVKGEQWFIIVFWTMAVEFQFYILISLLFPLLISCKPMIRLISYLLVFGLALFLKSTIYVPVWMPVFMMGTIYISYRSAKINLIEFLTIFIAAIVFSTILHSIIVTVIAVFTIVIIHFFSSYQSKLGTFLGSISYSLYLTHTLFGSATINILVPHVSLTYTRLLVVLLSFGVSIVAAYFFYLWIEKPFKKYAAKIKLS